MEKKYLLLRKNKQSGPFTLNELVSLELKSLDLIWEEGRSKNWSYPSEMYELKDFVKEDKIAADAAVYPIEDIDLVMPRLSSKEASKKQEGIHVEVYVKLPERYTTTTAPAEKKPSIQQPVSDVNISEDETPKDEGYQVLNKKYVRDLDDIKKEYAQWIGRQKNNPLQPVKKKFLLIWAVFIVLIAAGFISERWSNDKKEAAKEVGTDSINIPAKPEKAIASKTQKTKKQSASENGKSKKQSVAGSAASKEKLTQNRKKEEEQEGSDEAEKTEGKQVNAEAIFKKLDVIFGYDTSRGEGMHGLHFRMRNKSEQQLNAVALDVYYKDISGELLQKETVYFNDLAPGSSITASGTPPQKAAKLTYRTALISIDGINYYH